MADYTASELQAVSQRRCEVFTARDGITARLLRLLDEERSRRHDLLSEIESLRSRLAATSDDLSRSRQELDVVTKQRDFCESAIRRLRRTLSWRITWPIRQTKRIGRFLTFGLWPSAKST